MKRKVPSPAETTKALSDDQTVQSKKAIGAKQHCEKKMTAPRTEPVIDYQLFADTLSDLICSWRPDTTLIFVNTSYCKFFGKTRHELLGSPWVDLVPAEQRDAVVEVCKDLARRPGEHRYTHQVIAEGGLRWIEWTDSPLFDASESLFGFQSIGRDITAQKLLEDRLRRSESLLQESQRIAQVGSWDWDFESGRIDWSDEVYGILEIDPGTQTPSYERFLETVHPDDRRTVDQRYQDLLGVGEDYEFEHRLLMSDGRIKYVRERGVFQTNLSGQISRAVGTVQDITGPVALHQKLELITTAVETAVSGIAIADRNGLLTFVNTAFLALWGEKHAEKVLGRLATSFWDDPDKADHVLERLQRDRLWGGELVARRRDGTTFTVHLAASAVLGDDGTVSHFLASFSDLSEQRKIEKDLRVTSDLFQKLLQMTREGFWLVGDGMRICDVNNQACRMLGYSREEMLTMRIPDIDANETPAETEQHVKDFLATGYDLFETKHRAKDGTLIDVEITASSWISGNQIIIAAFIRDITKQKELEETKKLYELAQKTEDIRHALFSRVSHELMTPLHPMIGLSEQLNREPNLANGHRTRLRLIADEARRLKQVLGDMLMVTNLHVGSSGRDDQSFEFCCMIENLINSYLPKCLEKTLSLQVEIDEHTVPCHMIGDKEKIMTILERLLDNALDNTDQGTIRLRINAEQPAFASQVANDQVLTLIVEIEDSGIGIVPERLSALLSLDGIKAAQGTGEGDVGLYICLMLAKVIGAEITAVSRLGEGSCFRLRVPVHRDNASGKDESHCRQRIRDLVTLAPDERLATAEHEVANLPEQLQQQLKEALAAGDMILFTELLDGARAFFPAATGLLLKLAETFNYRRIAQLLNY